MLLKKNKFATADYNSIGTYLVDLAHDHTGHHHSTESSREAIYKNHKLTILTTYKITVDGKELKIPLGIDNDGILHCHALPNYQFASAIEMLKNLIDQYPDDFEIKRKPKSQTHNHHKKMPTKKTSKGRK